MVRIPSQLIHKPFLVIGAILALTAAAVLAYSQLSKGPSSGIITSKSPLTSPIQTNNDKQAGPTASSGEGGGSSTPGSTGTSSGSLPLVPYGSFVSNHAPGQNGSPTTEYSVCSTTPGATCYIKFSLGDISRQLSTQKVDDSGSTTWQWDIDGAGLSKGSWQITAVATLNGQSKSTTDHIPLKVP